MIKYMIMNKELTQVYAGTCVFDDKDYAEHHLSKLNCSNNWSVKQVSVEPEVMRQIDIVGGNDIKDILKFIEDLILQNFCSSDEEFKQEYPEDEGQKHTITLSA